VPDHALFPKLLFTLPVVALVFAAGSVWGAFALASDSFAQSPRLSSSGSILVTSSATSPAAGGPVSVTVLAGGTTDQQRARLDIAVTKAPSAEGLRNHSNQVVFLFLCGRIARDPRFVDNLHQTVTWRSPNLPQGRYYSSAVGDISKCVYARLVLGSKDFGQALLLGSSEAPLVAVSGPRVLYSLPGVVTLPLTLIMGGLTVSPPPRGSTAKVSLSAIPSDFQLVTGSPQLPDSGRLQWKADLAFSGQPPEYRLSGTLLDQESSAQHGLFLAGALIGVAGSLLIWSIELLANAITARRRGRRVEPKAPLIPTSPPSSTLGSSGASGWTPPTSYTSAKPEPPD
jgi:hypothetical protein